MHITLLVVGKTDNKMMDELTSVYRGRLVHYIPFEMKFIPDVRRTAKTTPEVQKEVEGREILKQLSPTDSLILFDERGREYNSLSFAAFLEGRMNASEKRLVFAIGGAYGFSQEVYQRAKYQISLSKMTFSHQMVRLFAVEQIYRAMTILRGEPYHHE